MRHALFALVGLFALLPWGKADTILSFTGNLRTDANVTTCQGAPCNPPLSTDADYAQFTAFVGTFNVATPADMKAITFSYGGGTNGNSMVIPRNGFEPYLSLFDASGNFLASTFGPPSGILCPAGANTNVDTGHCYDVELKGGTLAIGGYQIAISAFENMSFAENLGTGTLADGFTGLGNLQAGEDLHYAFDVTLTSPTSIVPEPGSFWVLASAALAMTVFRKITKG